MKPVILFCAALLGCAAVEPQPPATPAHGEPGYVNADGDWRPCDPISPEERPYVGGPGWKQACNGAERMAGVATGDPGADPDEDLCSTWQCGSDR